MKLFARRVPKGLIAADEASEEALRKIPIGKWVTLEVKQSRNPKHHSKFFALLKIVFDNQERFKSLDALLVAIKIAVGRYTEYPMSTGEVVFVPESISFEAMGQDEFSDFYDRALDVIARDFLPGINKDDLRAEVEAMLTPRAA